MAITLVVEDGSGLTSSNCYCTSAEATTYNLDHPHGSSWQAVGSEDKNRAILMACRLLDEEVEWHGAPVKDTNDGSSAYQSLSWPRSGATDLDGNTVHHLTIPVWLKNANAELARHLADTDRTAEPATRGYSSVEVGSLKVAIDKTDTLPVLPRSVVHMISPYGDVRFSHSVKLRRT